MTVRLISKSITRKRNDKILAVLRKGRTVKQAAIIFKVTPQNIYMIIRRMALEKNNA